MINLMKYDEFIIRIVEIKGIIWQRVYYHESEGLEHWSGLRVKDECLVDNAVTVTAIQ